MHNFTKRVKTTAWSWKLNGIAIWTMRTDRIAVWTIRPSTEEILMQLWGLEWAINLGILSPMHILLQLESDADVIEALPGMMILKDSKVGNGETVSTCSVDDYMRVARDALNAKRYEMDSVLPMINRMKIARSIDDMLVM
ncbi:hypothetical protein GIB67_003210 [Kingdonia uniflora]|uniref:Uncharacterized protein n=1 Tax=Kingdonia uniflora TaxID=39325 RepID=A0A7J7LH20_9MAGN|nr:hypothetical protein GIB67_003210 [Kingdonia uniflora]